MLVHEKRLVSLLLGHFITFFALITVYKYLKKEVGNHDHRSQALTIYTHSVKIVMAKLGHVALPIWIPRSGFDCLLGALILEGGGGPTADAENSDIRAESLANRDFFLGGNEKISG